MLNALKAIPRNLILKATPRNNIQRVNALDPVEQFHSEHYLRHNARRLEHLASLRIPVAGISVLEVGAGIGDLSNYYLDRGCRVTITEAREESLAHLRRRYLACEVLFLDMEHPPAQVAGAPFDVVHCYGLLYHLSNPVQALAFLRRNTRVMLLLETCVSFGDNVDVGLTEEPRTNPSQSFSGMGCRPTRQLLWDELRRLYPFVYVPKTQPNHEEFPLDWHAPSEHRAVLQRAIFVASLEQIRNDLLIPELLMRHTRHE